MRTKQKLAIALNAAKAPQEMIERALNGYYDDFESELEMPCVQLVNDLKEAGLSDLAERAMNGEFDSTREESEAWYQKEGKDIIKEMS